jgi:hypothetical protein
MSSTSPVLKEETEEKGSETATAGEADDENEDEEEKSLADIIDAYSE